MKTAAGNYSNFFHRTLGVILLSSILFQCSTPEMEPQLLDIQEFNTEMVSNHFLEIQLQGNYDLINIDSLQNYSQLIDKAQKISCDGKAIGIEFTLNDTIYKLTGWTECPTRGIISCHMNINNIIIKNDSLISFAGCLPKMRHIHNLGEVLAQIGSEDYQFQHGTERLRPALINLHVEDKYPISKTKEVVKTVVQEFKTISLANGSDYFRYHIFFDGYSILDIPPPPPPPEIP